MQRIFSKFLLLAVIVSVGVGLSFVAQSGKKNLRTIQVVAGKAGTVDLPGPVADILVANPAIADVGTLRVDRLYVVGRAVGDTNVLAYDVDGNQLADIAVHVRVDDKNLQDTLSEFFPDEKIKVKTVRENIVLSGLVSTPSVSNQVRDLASRFITNENQTIVDLMTVRGEQQVMLKVKVIEANRSALRELGFDTDIRSGAAGGLIMNGSDVGRVALTPFATGTLLVGQKGRSGPFATTVRALEQSGMINTLAEPNLTAISGETAGFLAGGEYPVPTGRDTQGNVIIEFKQFGVSLNFTPTVLNKNRIALHLSTEVSEKDKTNGVTLVDVQVDGLRVRRAETTVEVGSGGTIMMAGLIKSDTLHSLNGLPGVQDLPILGQLFKSKSFTRNESELIIMVTPYLVKPYSEPEAVVEVDAPSKMQKALEKAQEEKKEKKKLVSVKELLEEEKLSSKEVIPSRESSRLAVKEEEVPKLPRVAAKTYSLSESLMKNLKKTYGNHIPKKIGASKQFGYIID